MVTPFIILYGVTVGLLTGGLYALMAVGLSLTWGVMKVMNLAHASFAVLAAYITYFLFYNLGIDPIISLVISLPVLFIVGAGTQQFVTHAIRPRAAAGTPIVVFFAFLMIMTNVMTLLWSGSSRGITTAYTQIVVSLANMSLPVMLLSGFVISVVTITLLHFFLGRTYLGKAMRSTAEDKDTAMTLGVNANKVSMMAFGIGAALAGLGGVFWSLTYTFDPYLQVLLLGRLFVIVVLGGMGSIYGTLIAALLMGIAESLTVYIFSAHWAPVVSFSILIVVLIARPKGLFGSGN